MNIGSPIAHVQSVCVYCGSSNAADPAFIQAAANFGRLLAAADIRMVYGGGGVGLMGACAKAAHDAGGRVLGVIPEFLCSREVRYDAVETVIVPNMHERKRILFEESDAFVVLPGGIGTLEEIVELLSWKRLALHNKPVVFYSPRGFWDPFFTLIDHTMAEHLTPVGFDNSWRVAERVEDILPAIRSMAPAPMAPSEEAAATRLT